MSTLSKTNVKSAIVEMQAVSLAEEAAFSELELDAYESYWDMVSTEKTLLTGEEGKMEEKYNMARRMSAEGMSVELIQKVTQLDVSKLLALTEA